MSTPDLDPATRARLEKYYGWHSDIRALLAAYDAAVADKEQALEAMNAEWAEAFSKESFKLNNWVSQCSDENEALRARLAAAVAERDRPLLEENARVRNELARVTHLWEEAHIIAARAEAERDQYAAVVRAARALDTAIQWSGQDDGTVIGMYLHKPTADALHAAVAALPAEGDAVGP